MIAYWALHLLPTSRLGRDDAKEDDDSIAEEQRGRLGCAGFSQCDAYLSRHERMLRQSRGRTSTRDADRDVVVEATALRSWWHRRSSATQPFSSQNASTVTLLFTVILSSFIVATRFLNALAFGETLGNLCPAVALMSALSRKIL